MKNQVFIIADIGLGEQQTFHVGDEAMFVCNMEHYKDLGFAVVASSRSLSHKSKLFDELLDIYITSPMMFLRLITSAFVLKVFALNLFPKFFHPTIDALRKSSLLHISGGGNLTSLWPGHIYYRSLMICIAWLYKIPTKVTSQTIGPIDSWFHAFVLRVFLNRSEFIGVRDGQLSLRELKRIGVLSQKVHRMTDDALLLESIKTQRVDHGVFNIGLSLHSWGSVDANKLKDFLSVIHKEFSDAHFYLIPHMFDKNGGYDSEYMLEATSGIPPHYIHNISPATLLEETDIAKIPGIIKGITSEMDIVFSTRYHGLVFALSSDVPAIAINYDLYYETKNNSAFTMARKIINRLEYQSFSVQEGIELVKKTINLYDKTC